MQQVNLFTDAFKPPKVKLPLEQLIVFPLLVLSILVALSFGLSAYLESEKKLLADLQTKDNAMAGRLAILDKKAEKLRQDDGLIAANQRLNKTLLARQQMISTLDRVVLKEAEGFSHSLIALARQKEQGLWLTSILLGGTNNQMVIQGVTTKAELVPRYLQNLRQEASFLGKNFALFELQENTTNQNWLNYTLTAEDSAQVNTVSIEPLLGADMSVDQSSERVSNEP
tara:strand:+ start:17453 stop:18133 length:681 start_codon:yes stop_codon:yes gene_type:complete